MKVRCSKINGVASGFSLPDLLLASMLLTTGLAAVAWCHLFGLTLHASVSTKLEAASHERKLWGYLISDLASAERVDLGNVSKTTFTEVSDNAVQSGSALQIYPVINNTNQYIRYYRDTGSKSLVRYVSTNQTSLILATYIQNSDPFKFENSKGEVLSNSDSLFVVGITFSFSQFQEEGESIGTSSYYTNYSVSRKIAHRRAF